MEFFIRKGATLPLLKLNIVNNGRNDYDNFLNTLELSSLFFSMTNVDTGIPKIVNKPAGIGGVSPNYFVYYQFQNSDTTREGRFEAEFYMKNSDGSFILTLGEKLFVNIMESFITDDLTYSSCYVVDYACCNNPNPEVIFTLSQTPTPTMTYTPSVTPTETTTPTPTPSITMESTPSPTPTNTPTPTETPTMTPTQSETPTPTPTSQPCDCLRMSAGTEAEGFFEMTLSQNGTLNGKPVFEGISPTAEQLIVLYFNSTNSRWEALLNGNFYFDYLNSTSDCPISTNWISEFDVLSIYFTEGILCPTLTPTPTNTQTPTPTPTVSVTPSVTPTETLTPTPTPSTVTSTEVILSYDATDCGVACSEYFTGPTSSYYIATSLPLTTGNVLYTNGSLTTLADLGFYSDGTFCYEFCNNSGTIEICSILSCG